MPRTIQRAALGRMAKIGALYDTRTESFTSNNLFGSKIEDDDVEKVDSDQLSMEVVETDSLEEKLKQMDVEEELQVSVLSGLIKPTGSGAFIMEKRRNARTQRMSLLYKCETCDEEIEIRKNKSKIDPTIMSPTEGQLVDAIHVVVGIEWGAVGIVTCEYENNENEDDENIKASVRDQIEKLKNQIESVEIEGEEQLEQSNEQHVTFKCYTDVTPLDKGLQVTFGGAVDMMRNLPSLVKATNKEMGVPLTYTLMPLDVVAKTCKLKVQVQKKYRAIDEDVVKQCAQVLDGITQIHLIFCDIDRDMQANADFINEEALKRIGAILQKFRVEESRFKVSLQELVKEVKSGSKDYSVLEKLVGENLSKELDISLFNAAIRGFQNDINKIRLIQSWKSKGVIYIGRSDDVIVNDKRKVYVFYKPCEKHEEKDYLDKNEELFLRLLTSFSQDRDNYKFTVVDHDIRSDLWPAGEMKSIIHVFEYGVQTSTNLYSEEGNDTERCLIKVNAPVWHHRLPANRALVKLRCPNALSGNGRCSGNPVIWMCSKCKEVISFGTTTKQFHCNCGASNPRLARFRCNEKEHGMHYIAYQADILASGLSTLKAMKERNILILGETGVGKSTWINGLINYLYFADLEEAINSEEFHVLIPSSFIFTQRGKERKIQVGDADSNENMQAGKSATQAPRSYSVVVGGEIIHLIDTPGIGDSGGIEQDKKNFDNILSFLTYYEDIHAVCILLKPNNARLTVMFRFCIQELLTHLHSSAKQNIVFCFTNARATFYEPGDTLPALNAELKERNVGIEATPDKYFCFDNEPFRFLACVKTGVIFSPGDIKTYAESWNKSVEETNRLLTYIRSMKPHKIKNTLNMNEARRIIVAMSKPLAEVAKTIQQNVQEGNEAKDQIDLVVKDVDEMKTKLRFTGYGVKRTELSYPVTVCADSRCVKYVQVGKGRVTNTVYSQICHEKCTIPGVPTETTNDDRLQYCWAMRRTGINCRLCGHHYTTHMHITYQTEVVTEEFLSDKVQAQIDQKNSIKDRKEAFKLAIYNKIVELKEEERIIMKTSARYGSFLKANAIIPYNDAVGDYLDMCIVQERTKSQDIRNDPLLSTMETMKAQYVKERHILDGAIGNTAGNNIRTPEEVMQLQKELFGLKHTGKTLRDLFDGITISRSSRNISFEEKTAPIRQNYKKSTGSRSRLSIRSGFTNGVRWMQTTYRSFAGYSS